MRIAKPLLLVDVDGVISLFGFAPDARPAGRFEIVDGIAHFLSATAGEHLRRLADHFEPVWCTGWEEKANEYLPHALGLPARCPHLAFERDRRAHARALEARRDRRLRRRDARSPGSTTRTATRASCGPRSAPAPTLLVTTARRHAGMTGRADVTRARVSWASRALATARALVLADRPRARRAPRAPRRSPCRRRRRADLLEVGEVRLERRRRSPAGPRRRRARARRRARRGRAGRRRPSPRGSGSAGSISIRR